MEKGRIFDPTRSGRPRVTSQRQARAIRLLHLRYRHLTATRTDPTTGGTHNRPVLPGTVLLARLSFVGPPLTSWNMPKEHFR